MTRPTGRGAGGGLAAAPPGGAEVLREVAPPTILFAMARGSEARCGGEVQEKPGAPKFKQHEGPEDHKWLRMHCIMFCLLLMFVSVMF